MSGIIVSNQEIECLTSNVITKCLNGYHMRFECVDIDEIAYKLGLKVVYETIWEDNVNRIGFLGNGQNPLKIAKNGKVEQVVIPKKTIVVEKCLTNTSENGRRRFTIAHEVGHYILQQYYGMGSSAAYNTIIDEEAELVTQSELLESLRIEEYQADRAGGALLMPKDLVGYEMEHELSKDKMPIYDGALISPDDQIAIRKIIAKLEVTRNAWINRLKTLKLIDYRPGQEGIDFLFG